MDHPGTRRRESGSKAAFPADKHRHAIEVSLAWVAIATPNYLCRHIFISRHPLISSSLSPPPSLSLSSYTQLQQLQQLLLLSTYLMEYGSDAPRNGWYDPHPVSRAASPGLGLRLHVSYETLRSWVVIHDRETGFLWVCAWIICVNVWCMWTVYMVCMEWVWARVQVWPLTYRSFYPCQWLEIQGNNKITQTH